MTACNSRSGRFATNQVTTPSTAQNTVASQKRAEYDQPAVAAHPTSAPATTCPAGIASE
jgi:hypothetical protein